MGSPNSQLVYIREMYICILIHVQRGLRAHGRKSARRSRGLYCRNYIETMNFLETVNKARRETTRYIPGTVDTPALCTLASYTGRTYTYIYIQGVSDANGRCGAYIECNLPLLWPLRAG